MRSPPTRRTGGDAAGAARAKLGTSLAWGIRTKALAPSGLSDSSRRLSGRVDDSQYGQLHALTGKEISWCTPPRSPLNSLEPPGTAKIPVQRHQVKTAPVHGKNLASTLLFQSTDRNRTPNNATCSVGWRICLSSEAPECQGGSAHGAWRGDSALVNGLEGGVSRYEMIPIRRACRLRFPPIEAGARYAKHAQSGPCSNRADRRYGTEDG